MITLMMAVLHDCIHIVQAVNATVISLDEAPKGYEDFDRGVARKFVIEPHGLLSANG
jgi:glutathione-independent formaldehyde dehydrogenase